MDFDNVEAMTNIIENVVRIDRVNLVNSSVLKSEKYQIDKIVSEMRKLYLI